MYNTWIETHLCQLMAQELLLRHSTEESICRCRFYPLFYLHQLALFLSIHLVHCYSVMIHFLFYSCVIIYNVHLFYYSLSNTQPFHDISLISFFFFLFPFFLLFFSGGLILVSVQKTIGIYYLFFLNININLLSHFKDRSLMMDRVLITGPL